MKTAVTRERAKVEQVERRKAQIRVRVEHLVRVGKRLFGYTKARLGVLDKCTAQIMTFFALANLYPVRGQLLANKEVARLQFG